MVLVGPGKDKMRHSNCILNKITQV